MPLEIYEEIEGIEKQFLFEYVDMLDGRMGFIVRMNNYLGVVGGGFTMKDAFQNAINKFPAEYRKKMADPIKYKKEYDDYDQMRLWDRNVAYVNEIFPEGEDRYFGAIKTGKPSEKLPVPPKRPSLWDNCALKYKKDW